jgi:hypothetical protein
VLHQLQIIVFLLRSRPSFDTSYSSHPSTLRHSLVFNCSVMTLCLVNSPDQNNFERNLTHYGQTQGRPPVVPLACQRACYPHTSSCSARSKFGTISIVASIASTDNTRPPFRFARQEIPTQPGPKERFLHPFSDLFHETRPLAPGLATDSPWRAHIPVAHVDGSREFLEQPEELYFGIYCTPG